ncbi:hypothetical protein Nepgr_002601 [Nepenthes gracilis]|uniref:Transmembrane protein n=1 Tax=Nepenthes gracilis TaxID=150966 RepID=A0AAD3P7C5_NEPGR|nr:hypothetical protein Nepgr_002601 [Nepenthes gracilis]
MCSLVFSVGYLRFFGWIVLSVRGLVAFAWQISFFVALVLRGIKMADFVALIWKWWHIVFALRVDGAPDGVRGWTRSFIAIDGLPAVVWGWCFFALFNTMGICDALELGVLSNERDARCRYHLGFVMLELMMKLLCNADVAVDGSGALLLMLECSQCLGLSMLMVPILLSISFVAKFGSSVDEDLWSLPTLFLDEVLGQTILWWC